MIAADIDDAFFHELRRIAVKLGASSRDMLAVMYSESGCSATAHNDNPKDLPPEKRWNASGLIQFMPATLAGLGWTSGHAAFRHLTATQQLRWVEDYYTPYRGHLGSVGGLYVATFLPALIARAGDPDFVLTAAAGPLPWAYAPNKAFDANRDQRITVGELEQAVARNCHGPRWEELLRRLTELDGADTLLELPDTDVQENAASSPTTGPGPIIHPMPDTLEAWRRRDDRGPDDPPDEPSVT